MDAPLLALTRRRDAPPGGPSPETAATENMRQLNQLRWIAVVGQLATILAVDLGLDVPLPLAPMLAVVALLALGNLVSTALLARGRRVRDAQILVALLFDLGALTVQLYLSGGSDNPFISLYVMQIVLGAILLEAWSAWIMLVAAGLCFAGLTMYHLPLAFPAGRAPEVADLKTLGSWLSFALVGGLLLLFVTRITRNLRARDAYLADLRQHAMEEDHIVRMGLFASGAAHELGTPLATLAVILGDWRRVPKLAEDPDLAGEIGEMQEEVLRCKRIVAEILHLAGQAPGEEMASTSATLFLTQVIAAWRQVHGSVLLAVRRDDAGEGAAIVADPALRQAIWNLLDNAAEASADGVTLDVREGDGELVLTVGDRGPGFEPAQLSEFGKPRRSAKGPGHGVGLFLVSNVMRRLDGRVEARNLAEGGAEVTLFVPLAAGRHRRG